MHPFVSLNHRKIQRVDDNPWEERERGRKGSERDTGRGREGGGRKGRRGKERDSAKREKSDREGGEGKKRKGMVSPLG